MVRFTVLGHYPITDTGLTLRRNPHVLSVFPFCRDMELMRQITALALKLGEFILRMIRLKNPPLRRPNGMQNDWPIAMKFNRPMFKNSGNSGH